MLAVAEAAMEVTEAISHLGDLGERQHGHRHKARVEAAQTPFPGRHLDDFATLDTYQDPRAIEPNKEIIAITRPPRELRAPRCLFTKILKILWLINGKQA